MSVIAHDLNSLLKGTEKKDCGRMIVRCASFKQISLTIVVKKTSMIDGLRKYFFIYGLALFILVDEVISTQKYKKKGPKNITETLS